VIKAYRWVGLVGVFVLLLVVIGVPSLSAFQNTIFYQDRFNSSSDGWKVDPLWTYTEGQYRVFVRNANSITGSELPDANVADLSQYCAEVDIKLFTGSGLAEDGFVGFYIGGTEIPRRQSVPDRAVLFGVDSFERLLVLRTSVNSNNQVSLNTVTIVDDAFENPNTFHTLKLEANGSRVRVSIDDQFLANVSVAATGFMGFMAFTFNDTNLNARFDNVLIRDSCEEDS